MAATSRRSRPATLLEDHLDVTVLIKPPADVAPPRVTEFPVVKGTIRSAKGHLGAFELTVDDYAQPAPSSRGALAFGAARDGAVSRCDLVLDLSGGAPLFPAPDLRDGYLRADPGDPAAVLQAVLKARDLVGTLRQAALRHLHRRPLRAFALEHRRLHRCLDLCPTGAIAPAGDHVAIDAHICAGCGQCAAVCPTGAASYALPPADALMRRLRALLTTYREAGGTQPVVLLHDERARHAADRRARALRRRTAGECAAARRQRGDAGRARSGRRGLRLWRRGVRFLLRAKPRHDVAGLTQTHRARRADPRRPRLRRGPRRHDRDRRSRSRSARRCARSTPAERRAAARRRFMPVGGKRDVLRLALRELHRAAPAPVDVDRAARRRAVRHGRAQCRGLHAVPRLRLGLPDRRAVGRSRAADAALRRGRLRAMRAVQGDLPGEGDHAAAAARFPRRHRDRARAQGGGAVPLHPLRQAVRRQEHDRARHRQARRQALDVPEFGASASTSSGCARTAAWSRSPSRNSIPMALRRGRNRAPPKIICASARSGRRRKSATCSRA